MENRINTIATDITAGIRLLLEKMDNSKNAKEIVSRTSLQAGVHDYTRFVYNQGEIQLYGTDLHDHGRPDQTHDGTDFPEQPLLEEDVQQLLPVLQAKLTALLSEYDNNPILDFHFEIIGKFRLKDKFITIPVLKHISEVKKAALLEKISAYVSKKITHGAHPTKELETFFLSKHLVNPDLYDPLDVPAIIAIYDKILLLNKNRKEPYQQHVRNIAYSLEQWAENIFLPVYYNIEKGQWSTSVYTLKDAAQRPQTDMALLDLFLYAAILNIKEAANYSRPTFVAFLERAKELGSPTAADIIKTGSNNFPKTDTQYSDDHVTCMANDIFATFTITVKQETAAAYNTALTFICNLLEKGFPGSYEIKLKTKVKNYLPLKGLGKSSTQVFFANALQYPELYPQLAQYVTLAIRLPYEWYNDAEAELCARPGTYAAFGLGLAGMEYFSVVTSYMQAIDTEHQSVQNSFIPVFAQQYGVTPETIPTLLTCLQYAQDNKPVKELKAGFETPENMSLLLEGVRHLESYEAEHIAYFIWGGKEKLAVAAKKKGPLSAQMEELLALINKKD